MRLAKGRDDSLRAKPPPWPAGSGESPGCFWEYICSWWGVYPQLAVGGSAGGEACGEGSGGWGASGHVATPGREAQVGSMAAQGVRGPQNRD